jgi:ribonuclease-3 family protein
MEASLKSLLEMIREQFDGEDADIRTYSPLTLAYIGDGIYDLVIRTLMVRHGNCQPNKLHKKTSALVKASAQAEMIDRIQEKLTEEERSVYRRGRNAKSYTMAKNATMKDYRKATGFEALMGYLYLKEEMERMVALIREGLGEDWGQEEKTQGQEKAGAEHEI